MQCGSCLNGGSGSRIEIVTPGLAAESAETRRRAEETEATRVDFFTLVRGED